MEEIKNSAAYVSVEVEDKEKMDIKVVRKGNTKLQLIAMCVFLSRLAEKNGKKASDFIPFISNSLIKSSEV